MTTTNGVSLLSLFLAFSVFVCNKNQVYNKNIELITISDYGCLQDFIGVVCTTLTSASEKCRHYLLPLSIIFISSSLLAPSWKQCCNTAILACMSLYENLVGVPDDTFEIPSSLLQLALHLVSIRVDGDSFNYFITVQFPKSLALLKEWYHGNHVLLKNCIQGVLKLGFSEIVRGQNYVKALAFNFSPLMEQLEKYNELLPETKLCLLEIALRVGASLTGSSASTEEVFLVYAVPLSLQIIPHDTSLCFNFAKVLDILSTKYEADAGFPRIMRLHFCQQFFVKYLSAHAEIINTFFLDLISRGRKQDLKAITDLTMWPGILQKPYLYQILLDMFGLRSKILSHKKLSLLLNTLLHIVQALSANLPKEYQVLSTAGASLQQVGMGEVHGELPELPPPVVSYEEQESALAQQVTISLIEHVLHLLEECINSGNLSEATSTLIEDNLALVLLYQSLFSHELAQLNSKPAEEIFTILSTFIPPEILNDKKVLS